MRVRSRESGVESRESRAKGMGIRNKEQKYNE